MSFDYSAMPAPPKNITATSVLAHTIDSAGFRYYWATSELPDAALGFAPAPGSMGLGKLVQHMEQLAGWLHLTLTGEPAARGENARAHTLDSLAACGDRVRSMAASDLSSVTLVRSDGEALPIWSLIHGPLADFLTHVGQVTAWRRMAGCPAPAPRYAEGLGPIDAAATKASGAEEPRGLHVTDADLSESTFRDVALTGSTFSDVSLAGAKFDNATFAGATIHNVDLSNVNITDANIDGLRIDGELISD